MLYDIDYLIWGEIVDVWYEISIISLYIFVNASVFLKQNKTRQSPKRIEGKK